MPAPIILRAPAVQQANLGDFVHLHVHTEYSLLDGHSQIKELVKLAAELGMPALAITDHGGMYGVVDFYQAAHKAGVKPIIGLEGYIVPTIAERAKFDYNHLLLFAMNETGYRNLLALVTRSFVDGFYYKPRMDKAMLAQHSEGLIVTSGCLAGEIPQLILAGKLAEAERAADWYLEVFGRDRFFMEIQNHEEPGDQDIVNAAIIEMAKRRNLRLLATNDLHYVHKSDASAQDVMLCVQTGAHYTDPRRMHFASENYYLKNAVEMRALFTGQEAAITNTRLVAEMCNVELQFGQSIMPKFIVPTGEPADAFLYQLCLDGLRERYGEASAPLLAQLDYEFNLIRDKGFVDYFLIVWDYTNYARRQGMRCVARGSVAGSIAAYALGISNVDPLRYGLTFERFLNPDRTAMPDIDMDFPDDRREEVIRYVADKYGWDKVGQIATMNTMASKAAVRDVGRVFGDYETADRISRLLPNGSSLKTELANNAALSDLYTGDVHAANILNFALRLEGKTRNTGVHAAGVVISAVPLTDVVPCEPRDKKADPADKQWLVTQYEQAHLEELGLLKMDFLGLSNLTILQTTLRLIAETRGVEIDLDHIPTDDAAVFAMLGRGETTGIFQLESAAMRRYIRELQPTQVDDIMAMVALYRPGPMESIPRYIRAKHGQIQATYPHPDLEEILRETYGVIVYQDQVLLSVMKLAGYSWGEVDKFRKAIGKKIASEMADQREKFLHRCEERGMSIEQAESIFAFIEPFAGYGFNRAHAAAYGWVAYQTAWLKVHYPAEFLAASLTKEAGNPEKIALLCAEAQKLGVAILPPDIQRSIASFALERQSSGEYAVRFGLTAVKGIGEKPANALVEERAARGDYRTLADIFARSTERSVTSGTITALAQCGALVSLGERAALVAAMEEAKKIGRKHRGQLSLFADSHPVLDFTLPQVKAATTKQVLDWERDLLGVYLTAHPLDEVGASLASYADAVTSDLDDSRVNDDVKLAGRLTNVVRRKVKSSGADMATAMLEDFNGTIPVVCFAAVYAKNPTIWGNDQIVVLTGKVRARDGEGSELQLVVTSVRLLRDAAVVEAAKAATRPSERYLHIGIHTETAIVGIGDIQRIQHVTALLKAHPGKDDYEVWMGNGDAMKRVAQGTGIDYNAVYMALNALPQVHFSYLLREGSIPL